MIHINVNGLEFSATEGQTILDIAKEHNIQIPTMCHDDRVRAQGSCGICVVEVEGMPRLLRSCSSVATDGMIIRTDTARVRASRRSALELLLSDHTGDCRPPCVIACPGHTDCQGYVGLIANGEYEEALKVIKDKIPLPASIGRVCPHPCETACRRQLVEEPISIAHLKTFVADKNLESDHPYIPEIAASSGKTVAVLGGGPGGLSAAYFMAQKGHQVTIYDMMPKMGGMLRYGIPAYRLPRAVIDEEVQLIEELGVTMVNGVKIGRDISFSHIRDKFDVVLVAIGAWSSMKLGCTGEDMDGVHGGIDFLRNVSLNNPISIGKNVAVVGGGNTAMDACRTAIRLGAENVYIIYRRTKAEMPAEDIELDEAEEEGVIFEYLTNPIEIFGNGKVEGMRLQLMELGEPDASGRRSPVPIDGAEKTIALDTVIIAIGQGLNPAGFEELAQTKRKTLYADQTSYRTQFENVYAIGDATNKGASIAIEAIGDAKRASDIMHAYLEGAIISYKEPYLVTEDVTAKKYATREKRAREKMSHTKAQARRDNFTEVNHGYTQEQAQREASRCLECGCGDYFECKLITYANEYDVKPDKFAGEVHNRPVDISNPFMYRNPNKCILCGLCVRVCDEVMGRSALGLLGRGFNTFVNPELALPLAKTGCISCGQCVSLCPTGALGELLPVTKSIPIDENYTPSTCSYCSVGCQVQWTSKGSVLMRSLPNDTSDKESLLCVKGRFGFGVLRNNTPVVKPLIKKDGALTNASFEEACLYVSKKAQSIMARYGKDKLGIAVSDKYTNEEMFIIKEYAEKVLQIPQIYSFGQKQSGLAAVCGQDGSTVRFDELAQTQVIVLVAEDVMNTHTIAAIRIKQAVQNGAKLILLSNMQSQADEWADVKISLGNDLTTLRAFVKAVAQSKGQPQNADGFADLQAHLADVYVNETIQQAAAQYTDAKKAVIIYDSRALTVGASTLLADAAVIAGHIAKARSGILALKANNNSQGLTDMGITGSGADLAKSIKSGDIKGLLIFGEDVPNVDLSALEFLMVQDSILTETAKQATVVLPHTAAFETIGTYTSTDGHVQKVNAALSPQMGMQNIELIISLANATGIVLRYENILQIQKEISVAHSAYKGLAAIDDTESFYKWGGATMYLDGFATDNKKARLIIAEGNALWDTTPNTHGIYNRFISYLYEKELIK